MAVQMIQSTAPAAPKSMTHEQFMASSNFGTLTHDDLYWLLYRAATETGSSGNGDTFCTKVEALLAERLGAGRFGCLVTITQNSYSGAFDLVNTLLPNNLTWGGTAGVLPGFGEKNAVICLVWWS